MNRGEECVTCPHCGEVGDAIKWGKTRGGNSRLRCTECLRTFVAGPPLAGNYLPPDKEERLMEALCSGFSIRASARAANVSRATAQKYSRGLKVKCPCGDNARHRGWCWFRVQRSPRRQGFLRARWGAESFGVRRQLCVDCRTVISPSATRCRSCANRSTREMEWPFGGTDRYLDLVNAAVPKGLPFHVREDVSQEALLLLCSGEVDESDLSGAVELLIKSHYREYWRRDHLSLDQPLRGSADERTLLAKLDNFSRLGEVYELPSDADSGRWLFGQLSDPVEMWKERSRERFYGAPEREDREIIESESHSWVLDEVDEFGVERYVVGRPREDGTVYVRELRHGRSYSTRVVTLQEAQSIFDHSLGERRTRVD